MHSSYSLLHWDVLVERTVRELLIQESRFGDKTIGISFDDTYYPAFVWIEPMETGLAPRLLLEEDDIARPSHSILPELFPQRPEPLDLPVVRGKKIISIEASIPSAGYETVEYVLLELEERVKIRLSCEEQSVPLRIT